MLSCVFFFFQAEDGIRDKLVTGVQTCALPIWFVPHRFRARTFAKRVPVRPKLGTPCDFERCTPVWSPCSTTRATVSCHDPRRPRTAATAPQTAGCAARPARSLDALRFAHIPEEIRACPARGTCRADPLAGCPLDRSRCTRTGVDPDPRE